MEHDRDLPQAAVPGGLGLQMAVPLRRAPQKIRRPTVSPVEPDQLSRVQKGFGHVRPVDFKKPQHPGRVSTKPLMPLNDMSNRVR